MTQWPSDEQKAALERLSAVARSGDRGFLTPGTAEVLVELFIEAQARGPLLPEVEHIPADVISLVIAAWYDTHDRGNADEDMRAALKVLREELLRPKTRKAWRVTAVSPGGMAYSWQISEDEVGGCKATAKMTARSLIDRDYSNVSVTKIEVPA